MVIVVPGRPPSLRIAFGPPTFVPDISLNTYYKGASRLG